MAGTDTQAMVVAALIVSIFAVLVAAVAAWYTRGQKLAADRATRVAEEALELGRAQERRAVEAEERAGVVWRLEHISGMQYILSNQGTQTAYDVHVELGDFKLEGGGEEDFDEFPADHEETYLLGRGLGSAQKSVSVTWSHGSDRNERRQQRLVLAF